MTIADVQEILTSVAGVFGLIALGAWCRRRRWLNPQADVSLANLATNVLLPALFLDRILGDPTLDSIWQAWSPPLMGFTATATGFLLAFMLAKKFGPAFGLVTDASQRAFALCAGICNYGYVPLPLAQTFYPDAEVELILHNVGVDVALWSVGVAIIAGGGTTSGAKMNPEFRGRRPGLGSLLSPPLIAVVVALTLRFSGAADYLSDDLLRPIGLLAGAAIPMGLLLSGAIIIDFLKAAPWRSAGGVITAAVGYRQLVMPALMIGVTGALPVGEDLRRVMVLEAAMPAAVFPIVLTRLYGGDTETALRVVLSTSLIAVVLIPVWIAAGAWWLGV